MSEYSNSVDVDEIVSVGQLFDSIFIIRQRIIAHIIVSIGMISLSTHWSTPSVAYGNYNESQLSQTGVINIIYCETSRHVLEERPRINI